MAAQRSTACSIKPSVWFVLLAAALTGFALWGAARLPFHPDESTTLYMSGDFEVLWTNPLALAWAPGQPVDLKIRYRLLDAPLSRQILGLARAVWGFPALPADWRWDQSWEWNRQAGALPSDHLLAVTRGANTVLLPFSLLFLYLSGRILGGEALGLGAATLLGMNALALLHTRRAMAESALLLGVCFCLWLFLSGRSPWWIGLGLALAFNAKQSAIALLPVGLLAAAWPADTTENKTLAGALLAWGKVALVFGVVTALLNPVFWRQPAAAMREAVLLRSELAAQQSADAARLAPGKNPNGYGARSAALLINLFMAPPAFAEYGNYTQETLAAEQAYLAVRGHRWMRGVLPGGLMLAAAVFGLAVSILHFRRAGATYQRALMLAWLATAVLGVGLVMFFSLAWQRYVIPLVPLACLWCVYPLTTIWRPQRKPQETP